MLTLTELCAELNNWFTQKEDIILGDFTVENNTIDLSALVEGGHLQSGQYFRIIGSRMQNDGVYQYADNFTGLNDEMSFSGAVWCMRVPKGLLDLLDKINEWIDNYDDIARKPFRLESYQGVYSYEKASGLQSAYGNKSADVMITWQTVFAADLNKWRKA